MLKRLTVLILLLGAGLLMGCGQKGPLYLPAPPTEEQSEPTGTGQDKPVVKTQDDKPSSY